MWPKSWAVATAAAVGLGRLVTAEMATRYSSRQGSLKARGNTRVASAERRMGNTGSTRSGLTNLNRSLSSDLKKQGISSGTKEYAQARYTQNKALVTLAAKRRKASKSPGGSTPVRGVPSRNARSRFG